MFTKDQLQGVALVLAGTEIPRHRPGRLPTSSQPHHRGHPVVAPGSCWIDARAAALTGRSRTRRFRRPEEVAAVAAFLSSSSDASFVSGQAMGGSGARGGGRPHAPLPGPLR